MVFRLVKTASATVLKDHIGVFPILMKLINQHLFLEMNSQVQQRWAREQKQKN